LGPGGVFNFMEKKSNLILLIIIFLVIAGLIFLTYHHFKDFQKSISQIKPPEFKVPEINLELTPEPEEQQEFITPVGDLKLKYPGNWVKAEQNSLLNKMKSEKGEVLLVAYKFVLRKPSLSFLVIQQLNLEGNLKEIIEEMKKDVESKGNKMEIINLKMEEKEAQFEASYKTKNKEFLYARERLILVKENCYSIAVFSQEETWPEISKEADFILNSIQIIE